uniref:Uncharacterized protein n=1 Tax=Meloidogyne enterolobii TaxID=390850 RepID=A0A6V7VV63_MELEN|nr:unnamed protein product [Meloidogyne enterolobii]
MSFNFPPGPNYTATETKIFLAADIVELAANSLLACPISTINFILILKTSILHPNLKLILLCQSLCIFIRGIGRIILNIARLYLNDCGTYGPSLLNALYMQPIYFRNCLMHVLIIERIIATFNSKNYEKHRSNLFLLSWLTITAIIGYLNSLSSNYIISFSILFTLVSLGILEIWALFWILDHNKRNYERKLLEGRHELSERYQLSENIRTAKQLIPCILMHFICIIIPGINNIVVFFNLYSDKFISDFVGQCIFTTITIGSFLIEFFMIM